MNNLFEYQNKIHLSESADGLEEFLETIWEKREKGGWYDETASEAEETQQFIQFLHKTSELRSQKYVGVIHFDNTRINLLPKIFFDKGRDYTEDDVTAMQYHILWWLSYCRKIKFPSYKTGLEGHKSDFFEVLIYLFARYTLELLNNSIYQQYDEVDEELSYIKGRLNVQNYITENLSRGRWHKLNCSHDPVCMDNKFNRIVKYVTSMLLCVTTNDANKRLLQEILIILDEVEDCTASAEDCASIRFNIYHEEFQTVKDYCYLFLSNSIAYGYKNDLKLFAFLLPMDYLFEDFLVGFINKELDGVKVASQKAEKTLDTARIFTIKPDMILSCKNTRLIADAKYKIILAKPDDPHKGISQSDLYQMLAYAVRFEIDQVLLIYPGTMLCEPDKDVKIIIEDEFAGKKKVTIRALQVPIINKALFAQQHNKDTKLSDIFADTRQELADTLDGWFKQNAMMTNG
ncbi:MAG: hypothetical protein RBS43_01960 [Candidatus Cloacimonas sp.]|jgi:5-methylcytosine-specific restriction enzyme subunit McrC|nr:hypothetical protein [Candidatus Cloacimonas sp.]